MLDVVVDVRLNSPTSGRHVAVELSEDNRRRLCVPRGFRDIVDLSRLVMLGGAPDALAPDLIANFYSADDRAEHEREFPFRANGLAPADGEKREELRVLADQIGAPRRQGDRGEHDRRLGARGGIVNVACPARPAGMDCGGDRGAHGRGA